MNKQNETKTVLQIYTRNRWLLKRWNVRGVKKWIREIKRYKIAIIKLKNHRNEI